MFAVQSAPGRLEMERDRLADVVRKLGPRFAGRAADSDSGDRFVAENFAELKQHGVFAAAVPETLGGGGASASELAGFLRDLARHCGSTALALSMHTHQVATNVWRWRREGAPVEPLLRRVAGESLILVGSGGSDWLTGSGSATRVEGGFRVKARKVFVSGAPAGDLLMTSAIFEDPQAGPTIVHFPVSLKADGVRILDTWRALGMRGTDSHDVLLEDVFIPEGSVGVRRPQGKWHPFLHTFSMVAFPLIYAVYVGVAEAARDKALEISRRRQSDPSLIYLVGEMENELAAARLAHASMLEIASSEKPGLETTNRIFTGRTLAGEAAIRTVEKALEVAGGAGYFRDFGLERLFRDVQAARFHPLQSKAQLRYSGRLALGIDVDD